DARIKAEKGIQWPCPEGGNGGARLYTDGHFRHADGKAKLITLPFDDNNERPDDSYPFWLNSGRVVEHFHTRTKTGKIGNLNKFSPTPYMEINPDAAQAHGVEHMGYVRLVSRRGDAVVMAQLTHRVWRTPPLGGPRTLSFTPFHSPARATPLPRGLLYPYSRQPAFKQCAVGIEAVAQVTAARLNAAMRRF